MPEDSDDDDVIRLAGPYPLSLHARLWCRIVISDDEPTSVSVAIVGYFYRIATTSDREVIAFHWNPMATPPQRTYPHLHIGSLVSSGSLFLPDRFNKLHIPAGPLSLQQVLRFAIEELDVRPPHGRTQQEALAILAQGDDEVSGPPSSS